VHHLNTAASVRQGIDTYFALQPWLKTRDEPAGKRILCISMGFVLISPNE
jgi:hypothetical protein